MKKSFIPNPNIPVKFYSKNDVIIGSDNRFTKVISNLTDDEIRYIKHITSQKKLASKELNQITAETKANIDKLLSDFVDFPNFYGETNSLDDWCVELGNLSELELEIAKNLLKLGLNAIYIENESHRSVLRDIVIKWGYSENIVHKTRLPLTLSIFVQNHNLKLDSANHLMEKHIPYIVVLQQGTKNLVFPLNILGKTPCLNCNYYNLQSQVGEDVDFESVQFSSRLALTNISANIIVSRIVNYVLTGVDDSEIAVISDPNARIGYLENKFNDKCNCSAFKVI